MNTNEFMQLARITGKLEAIEMLIEIDCKDEAIKKVAGSKLKEMVGELVKFREDHLEIK